MKTFLFALLAIFAVTPAFAQEAPAAPATHQDRILPGMAPDQNKVMPAPAPMPGGAMPQLQPQPQPPSDYMSPLQGQPASDQGARPMYHTPPYTSPTPEQLENARIAQEMLDESYWSSMLIGSAPILLILIIGGFFFFVKMKNDTKLAKSYIESAGDSKLIQERQRLMLDHIASIDKNLQIIVQKLDKLP